MEYKRIADDLISLNRLKEADEIIQEGLIKFSNKCEQFYLLLSLSDIFRAMGDRSKRLKLAEFLISEYPCKWEGYIVAINELICLQDMRRTRIIAKMGLSNADFDERFISILGQLSINSWIRCYLRYTPREFVDEFFDIGYQPEERPDAEVD